MFQSSLRRRLCTVAGSLALVTSVIACSAPVVSDASGGLAMVVGAHSNMPPTAVGGVAEQVLTNAVRTRSAVSVVVADGAPFVLDAEQSGTAGVANREALDEALTSAAARTPETDLLTALGLGAAEIASADGRRTVLVVDSGLSTTGALDFRREGLLDADPADVVGSLQAAGALPDLSGVHVVFQGLGDTAAPQPSLGEPVRRQLADLWTAVALAAGALDVSVERTPLVGEPVAGLPPVSLIGLGGGVTCTQSTVVLDGGAVAFQADTSAFQDAAAAAAELQPIADRMRAAGVTATLVGTTADVGDAEGQRRLSEQRARAVADLLGGLGVPAERLTVVGLGSDFPGYVQDRDASGTLDPAAAAQNRKVTIELVGAGSAVCA
ncbi:OmpA family protein [Blastococcus sp. HT6-30]|uniref:OmpA family protein n=1 Tax=Blastococcus sp. HT6-30 TaxID=3144843 RepID=UPI00321A790B